MTQLWLRSLARQWGTFTSHRNGRRPRLANPARDRWFRPQVELLEDRITPNTYTPTSTANSGANTLREAVTLANANPGIDTIRLDLLPSNSTITLSSELVITETVAITEQFSRTVTISGGTTTRIFNVSNGSLFLIAPALGDITLANGGGVSEGGAIYNGGGLVVRNIAFSNNTVRGADGASGTDSGGTNPNAGGGGGGGAGLGGAIFSAVDTFTEILGSSFNSNQAIGGNGGASDNVGDFSTPGGAGGGNPGSGGSAGGGTGGSGGFGQGGGGGGGNTGTGGAGGIGGFGGGGGGGGDSQNAGGGAGAAGGIGGGGGNNGTGNSFFAGGGGGGGGAGAGGAIFNRGGIVYVATSTFTNNQAIGGTGGADDTDVLGGAGKGQDGSGIGNEFANSGGQVYWLVVLNTSNSGVGSLRGAITDANQNGNDFGFGGGADIITFNIPTTDPNYSAATGVFTIAPTSALPAIDDKISVRINGYSQTGSKRNSQFVGNDAILNIKIDGASAGANTDGLVINSDNVTVSGLIIDRFQSSAPNVGNGIVINGQFNVITGNFIGVDSDGSTLRGNGWDGIHVNNSFNTIGGPDPDDRNVISGNKQSGIALLNDANVVENNYIGTDKGGTLDRGNVGQGIYVNQPNNTITGNVISGNDGNGVFVTGTTNTLITGNYLGVGADGSTKVKNVGSGIILSSSNNNTISGNVSSANGGRGIQIDGTAANNLITGANTIGLAADGVTALGNVSDGIFIGSGSPSNNTISGGNIIAANGAQGIYIGTTGSTRTLVTGNYIGTNPGGKTGLGNDNGVWANGSRNNTITGNTIASSNNAGVRIDAGSTGNLVSNNNIGTDGGASLANNIGVHLDNAATNTVSGNLISANTTDGIRFTTGANNNLVTGNRFGVNAAGDAKLGNGSDGIDIVSGSGNTIGGTTAAARNVISGSASAGVRLQSGVNLVIGNYIGLAVNGTAGLGAGVGNANGIVVSSGNNIIGGTAVGAGNVISNNTSNGIVITGSSTTNTQVVNNLIGLNPTGTSALPNAQDGIHIQSGATLNAIGGTAANTANFISGNGDDGIQIDGSNNNAIVGNFIGTQIDMATPLANAGNGIFINNGASNNSVGGAAAGQPNVIQNNTKVGVRVDGASSDFNRILSNSIFLNSGGGITLTNGGNNNQAAPVLQAALNNGVNTGVIGMLTSTPNTQFRIEFYGNTAPGPGNIGEGQTLLGVQFVTTTPGGTTPVFLIIPSAQAPVGTYFSATATSLLGDTSEFSADEQTTGPAVSLVVTSSTSSAVTGVAVPDVTVRAVDANGNTVRGYTGTIHFTSSDGTANLPPNYTFNPTIDRGQHTFNNAVIFNTPGQQTLTAADTVDGSIFGFASFAVQAPTTMALSSSVNPSLVGQSVTFTAIVNTNPPGAGTVVGTVSFSIDSTVVGFANLSGGVATYTTSSLLHSASAAFHNVQATYTASKFFGGSSASLIQTVNPDPTTTTLTVAPSSGVSGQNFSFQATVTPTVAGAGFPDGTVNFIVDGGVVANRPVNSGVASYVGSLLASPGHSVSAVYLPGASGDYLTSTSPTVVVQVNKADTTTTIVSSANPISLGGLVTFTATVAANLPGSGTPAGSVSFYDGGTLLGSKNLMAGTAFLDTTTLPGGSRTITAKYNGNSEFNISTSAPLAELVIASNSTTLLVSSLNPSFFGEAVTFTAQVTGTGGTPTGTVTFMDNSSVLGTGTLSGIGVATLTTTGLTVGTHGITAVYAGDGSFNPGTSAPVTQLVRLVPTTTTLTPPPATVTSGQAITFTATVTPMIGTLGTPSGIVTFMDGATSVGTGTLDSSGVATITTTSLGLGNHAITAGYGGTSTFAISTSSPAAIVRVDPSGTNVGLTTSAASAVVGQPVTFTATVSTVPPGGAPIGSIDFVDLNVGTGVTITTNVALTGGTASLTTSLTVGNHTVTATYKPTVGSGFPTSTSPAVAEQISPANTTTTLTAVPSPSNLGTGVLLTATVSAVLPGAGTPASGDTVTFFDAGVPIGTAMLSGGVFQITTGSGGVPALTGGVHTLTATFNGDANLNASTSAPLMQLVNKGAPTIGLTSSVVTAFFGDPVTFTATVGGGAVGVPATGSVTFKEGTADLGTVTLTGGGLASLTTTTLTLGSHSVTAVYSGDVSYSGVTSSVVTVSIQGATTTLLESSVNPSTFGELATFTATVSSAAGVPTGSVTFRDVTNPTAIVMLGTATLTAGKASVSSYNLAVVSPSHTIQADFVGSGGYQNSTVQLGQVVAPAATKTALATSSTPSVFGQSVVFTATIATVAPGGGVPVGDKVNFFLDGSTTAAGSGTVASDGTATFSYASLFVGTHSVTASFSPVNAGTNAPDPNFLGSSSAAVQQVVTKANTTASVTSDKNPSKLGDPVTFSAVIGVASPGGFVGTTIPTGIVTFLNGTQVLQTVNLPTTTTGTTIKIDATAISTLPLGDNSITVVYSGDSNFNSGTSAPLVQTVVAGPTTTTLTSSANPAVYGQPVTFTATVTAGNAPTNPTGTVFFYDSISGSPVQIGTADLSGGSATFTISTLSAATTANPNHPITAKYGGTQTFGSSTSTEPLTVGGPVRPPLAQVINPADTTTVLTVSTAPSVFGQTVTFTATVSAVAPGVGTPTGTVAFFVDGSGTAIGTSQVVGGKATLDVNTLPVGSHTVQASYVFSDPSNVNSPKNYNSSNSTLLTQIVNKSDTSVALSSSQNPSNFGNLITLKATVSPTAPGGGTPTGTVTFMDGTTVLDSMSVANAATTGLQVSTLSKGTHILTAVYSGDSSFNTATSADFTQTVQGAKTQVTLTDSPSGPTPSGQPITLKADIAYVTGQGTKPTNPSTGATIQPSGTVTFKEGTTVLGTVTLTPDTDPTKPNGSASFTVNNATGGSHAYTAEYSGDDFYATSTATLTHTVQQAATTTTVSSSLNPAVAGQSVTFTASVVPVAPGAGTPTGTVTFTAQDLNSPTTPPLALGTGTLASGSTSVKFTFTQKTNYLITATYGGDSSFLGTSGAGSSTVTLTQMITSVPFVFVL